MKTSLSYSFSLLLIITAARVSGRFHTPTCTSSTRPPPIIRAAAGKWWWWRRNGGGDRRAFLGISRGGSSSLAAAAAAETTTTTTTTAAAATEAPLQSNSTGTTKEEAVATTATTTTTTATRTTATTSPTTTSRTTSQQVVSFLPAWKRALPARLQTKGPKTLQRIQLGHTDIYLLGTAHVSNDSSADVDLLLNCLEPDCVFVELCDARIPLMEAGVVASDDDAADDETIRSSTTNTTTTTTTTFSTQKKNKKESFWQKVVSTQQTQGGSRLQALSSVLLTSVQEDYAKELGVELGGEFRCAYRYWKQKNQQQQQQAPPHLVLGDRPLCLTLVRAWESLWWWPKLKVITGLLWSSLHKPDKDEIRKWLEAVMQEESDVLTESFHDLRKHFPTLYTTIIEERDAWLAAKLVQTCRALQPVQISPLEAVTTTSTSSSSRPRKLLVAIVGAGHVPGITQWLTNTTTTTISTTKTPEQVLRELVTTRRWAKDGHVQNEVIPSWVMDVTELQHDEAQ